MSQYHKPIGNMVQGDTKLIAFDLAFSGHTGWSVWSTTTEFPLSWGEFRPLDSIPKAIKAQMDASEDVRFRKTCLYLAIDLGMLITQKLSGITGKTFVFYEKTDWHQDGSNPADYSRERKVQDSLGAARACLMTSWAYTGLSPEPDIISVGASKIKEEFGASDKYEVARLISMEFPKLFSLNKNTRSGKFLTDHEGNMLSHNVSDALSIGYIARRMVILELAARRR